MFERPVVSCNGSQTTCNDDAQTQFPYFST